MVQKYEVQFNRIGTHPYFVFASSPQEAKELALGRKNKDSQHKAPIESVVYCEPTTKVKVEDICEQFIFCSGQGNNVPVDYIEAHLQQISSYGNLILEPEFQRAHVWTEQQQIEFIQFLLKGGKSGRTIFFNRSDKWVNERAADTVLVDGLQRLTAVRKFMRNELKVFGSYTADSFEHLDIDLIMVTNNLKTEAEVLKWYLQMNAGGTPHTEAELDKVRKMLRNQ